jgi:flagellar biosynthesis protein FlhF
MDVRTFEATTMNDAIKLVKKEMGKDAVILQTNEKEHTAKETGQKLKLIEVIAMRSSASKAPTLAQKQNKNVHYDSRGMKIETVNFPRIQNNNSAIVVKENLTTKNIHSPAVNLPLKFENSFQNEEISELFNEIKKMRNDIQSLPQLNFFEQIQEIKIMLHDILKDKNYQNQSGNINSSTPENNFLSDIIIRLRTSGISEVLLGELKSNVGNVLLPKQFTDGSTIKDFYLSQCIQDLAKRFKVTSKFKFNENPAFVCLAGPYGVGKTTSLVKLAAYYQQNEKKRVGFVSLDSFRVGATDTLRIYAKILDAQFVTLSNVNNITDSLQKLEGCNIIFIDIPGTNTKISEDLMFLKELKNTPLPIHFHAVLSANMKLRDMEEALNGLKCVSPESFLVTKSDESWSYGEILSVAAKSGLPISLISSHAQVRESINFATKDKILEKIFLN